MVCFICNPFFPDAPQSLSLDRIHRIQSQRIGDLKVALVQIYLGSGNVLREVALTCLLNRFQGAAYHISMNTLR